MQPSTCTPCPPQRPRTVAVQEEEVLPRKAAHAVVATGRCGPRLVAGNQPVPLHRCNQKRTVRRGRRALKTEVWASAATTTKGWHVPMHAMLGGQSCITGPHFPGDSPESA
jgi:hypothetical protein